jgi:hypothetical protein
MVRADISDDKAAVRQVAETHAHIQPVSDQILNMFS